MKHTETIVDQVDGSADENDWRKKERREKGGNIWREAEQETFKDMKGK